MRRTFVLVALLGCGGAAGGPGAQEPEQGAAAAWMAESDDPLATEMRGIADRMRAAGLGVGPIEGEGFLTTGEQRTEAIEVPAGTCATIVAVAARGIRDLDATLFAPSGDVLAEDIEPDAHPTIQVCAGEQARRLYYGLHAYDGAGSYLFASFVGDRSSFGAAARIVGGRPGVVSDGRGRGDQDVRLRELTQGVSRRGFRPHGDPVAVPLAPDQRVRLPLEVERGHCYTVAALSVPGLEDVDVRVLDELDRELATDDAASADAVAQLCTDRDAHLAVEVHAAAGRGEARVAFFEAGDASVGGTSGLWLGERTDTRVARATLDGTVEAELRAARALGWRSPAQRGGGRLVAGEAVEHPVRIAGGGCTRIVASGGRGIGKLRLRVVSESGEVLADPPPDGPSAVATVCPDVTVAARAQVTARRGTGGYRLHVLRGSPPPDLPDGVPAAVRGGLVEALELARGEGWTLRRRPQAVRLEGEGAARVPVPPAADGCSLVSVVASEPVTSELVRDGNLEARASGRARVLTVCDAGGTPVVEIHGTAGTDAWVTIVDPR